MKLERKKECIEKISDHWVGDSQSTMFGSWRSFRFVPPHAHHAMGETKDLWLTN